MATRRIVLSGFQSADVVQEAFAAALVDVAYVDEITADKIFIVPDADDDFEKEFAWISEVIRQTLDEYGIHEVRIALES